MVCRRAFTLVELDASRRPPDRSTRDIPYRCRFRRWPAPHDLRITFDANRRKLASRVRMIRIGVVLPDPVPLVAVVHVPECIIDDDGFDFANLVGLGAYAAEASEPADEPRRPCLIAGLKAVLPQYSMVPPGLGRNNRENRAVASAFVERDAHGFCRLSCLAFQHWKSGGRDVGERAVFSRNGKYTKSMLHALGQDSDVDCLPAENPFSTSTLLGRSSGAID